MWNSVLKLWRSASARTRPQTPRLRSTRLTLEHLEDRTVPSTFNAATVSDLIADINAANLAGGSNTITLAAHKTFNLTAVNNITAGPTGLPVIAAYDNLTILGNGDPIARSTATGTPAFRLLDVASGASLNLANLTLQGGLAYGSGVSAEGGGIYNQGTLDLNGVTVQNNIAQGGFSTSAYGGGVYVAGGAVNLTNDSLLSNKAFGGVGGKIHYYGLPGLGGALYVAGGTVTLTSDTLSSNSAQGGGISIGSGFGGALYAAGGTITLRHDTITGNTAKGSSSGLGEGGGLYIPSAATLCLDDFTLAHTIKNTASTSNSNIFGTYNSSSFLLIGGFPLPTTAGVAGSFTVTAMDPSGNTLTGYTGIVHFSSSDPQAVLPADYRFISPDQGVHIFTVTLKTAGTQTITVTDKNTASLTSAQRGIYVNPAAASALTLSGFPASLTAGVACSVAVIAVDPYNNTVTNYAGTLHFTSSDNKAVLPGDYTYSALDQGAHTFTANLSTPGTQTITVTDIHTASVTAAATVRVWQRETFDMISLQEIRDLLQNVANGQQTINGSNDASNQIPAGTILIYRTNDGNFGKLQILQYGYDLVIMWLTYNADGSVLSQGNSLLVLGTWTYDLDYGVQGDGGNSSVDFWWEQVTDTVRYLVPQNGAAFLVY